MAFKLNLTRNLMKIRSANTRVFQPRYQSVGADHWKKGLVIREAREKDYNDILAIRTVYGGRDYLKDCFKYMIKESKGYVAVLDQKIIGSLFASIVDNGMSVLIYADRIKEEFEGYGISTMLDQHAIELCSSSVKYKVFSFSNQDPRIMKKVHNGTWNIKLCRKRLGFIAEIQEQRRRQPRMETTDTVNVLSPEDLSLVFSSEKLCRQLFPSNMLASHAKPLRIMKENIVHIFGENGVVVGNNVAECEDHSKALLTIGHTYSCELGQICQLDVYGHDAGHIIDHFAFFRNKAVSNTEEEFIILEVYAEPKLEPSIEKAMTQLGFRRHIWDIYSAMYYTECILRN